MIPYLSAIFGASSTFSLQTLIFGYSSAISSKIGASIRQGVHHDAQKSTITNFLSCKTSASTVSSVNSIIPISEPPLEYDFMFRCFHHIREYIFFKVFVKLFRKKGLIIYFY